MPVQKKFSFQSPDEFEYKAKKEIEEWIPRLAGKAFHVRMHRRGFKDRLKSVNRSSF
jgi:tRNA(Ser,Leu) C12 N-acetylase TAN1